MQINQDMVKKAGRPKTIVSDRRKQIWDKNKLMPKSLLNRPFYDISALHKISEDGVITAVDDEELLNSTHNIRFDSENLYLEQCKLGRIKALQTPSTKYHNSSILGTTEFTAGNAEIKTSLSKNNEITAPRLPEIRSVKQSSEKISSAASRRSSRRSKGNFQFKFLVFIFKLFRQRAKS